MSPFAHPAKLRCGGSPSEIEMAMYPRYETVLLLSGDGDFAPALRHIRSQGCRLEVAAYRPSTHPELIRLADRFVDLCAWQGTGIPLPLPAKQTAASG